MILTDKQIYNCQTKFLNFVKICFKANTGNDFIVNYHHEEICEALECVFFGYIKRLLINVPPRYSKTELAVVHFPAWAFGHVPDCEFIHASYGKDLASKNSWNCKNLIESDIYQQIFPHVALLSDSKSKAHWKTTERGTFYASGCKGAITGFGAGKLRRTFGGAGIIDDAHKIDEVTSDVKRKAVIDWFHGTMTTRLNGEHNPLIVIGQRCHELDLPGHLLNGGSEEKWEHICFPAINKKGKALWPRLHSIERLRILEKADPYVFAGQFMQNPSTKGGGLFKDAWWKFYKLIPDLDYKIITVDTAQKTKEYNDYSVFQCWGYSQNKIYLIDQIRGKWEAPDLRKRFHFFWLKHNKSQFSFKGDLRESYIEDKVSGTDLIQSAKREYGIPITPVQRYKDKITRAKDMIPYIESGFVYLPENAEFINDYLIEFSRFSPLMTHKHDDQIDATLDAIDQLLKPTSIEVGAW